MTRTFFHDFDRDDETPVTVEFTYRGGSPAHYGSMTYPGHPAEPPEVEIVKAFTKEEDKVTLTPAEDERFTTWLAENFIEDEPDDYHDYL